MLMRAYINLVNATTEYIVVSASNVLRVHFKKTVLYFDPSIYQFKYVLNLERGMASGDTNST